MHLNENIAIDKEYIKVVSDVKTLGIHIASKLNFNLHIEIICKSASNQLNARVRSKRYLDHEETFVLVNSFITQILITVLLYGCFQVKDH